MHFSSQGFSWVLLALRILQDSQRLPVPCQGSLDLSGASWGSVWDSLGLWEPLLVPLLLPESAWGSLEFSGFPWNSCSLGLPWTL